MKKSILVSIPVSPAHKYIHRDVFNSALQIKKDNRYKTQIITPDKNPFENNLHNIRNIFLNSEHNFWLNIDADNPPMGNPLDLVELDLDIVSLPTPVWHFNRKNKKKGESPVYWNAYKFVSEEDGYLPWPEKKGLQKVNAIGSGCMLISKRVFLCPDMQNDCFRRETNKDGTVSKGPDIGFSEKAIMCGFEIYAHFDYPCYHFVELNLAEAIEGFANLYNK